jgi:hypothetical protein
MNLSTVKLRKGLLSELLLNHSQNRKSPHAVSSLTQRYYFRWFHLHHSLGPSKIFIMHFGAQTLTGVGGDLILDKHFYGIRSA